MAFSLVGVFSLAAAPEYQQQALNSENTKLFWILGAIAFAFFVIALAVVILVVEVLKTRTKIMAIVDDLHGKSKPIIATSTKLLQELSPKVQDITANVQHISAIARNKIEEFEPTLSAANTTVKDANTKTHEQIVRVNELITNVLNSTNEIVEKVDAGIKVPFREASGIWAGLKAGVGSLVNGGRRAGRGGVAGQARVQHNDYPHYAEQPGTDRHGYETPATAAAAAAAAAFARAESRDSGL